MFEKLPTELLHIIWQFAYNWRLECDPWADLMLVHDIQESIPECFLTDRLPFKRIARIVRVQLMGHEFTYETVDSRQQFWQVYPPSPFKKGNAYLPSNCVEQSNLWSALSGELFKYLTKQGVQQMKTYRRVLQRRYTQHLNRNIFEWNQSFEDLFGDVRLCQIEHYDLKDCPWAWEFKNILLKQLSNSKFLVY